MPEYGSVEKLRMDEVPAPTISDGEVLIRVVNAGVNPVDWKVAAGYLDAAIPGEFPLIPGWDVAGVIEGVGGDITDFTVGDEVMGYVRYPRARWGTYGEYTKAEPHMITRRPQNLGWEESAGLPLAGLTAYQCLTAAQMREDDVVVIHAAAGGVGTMAVQLARAMGAKRIVGTASERNHGYLNGLGAEAVTYGPGVIERIQECLGDDQPSLVLDFIGSEAVRASLPLVSDPKRIVSIADREVTSVGGTYVFVEPDADDLDTLARMCEDGMLYVNVSQVFDLDDAAEAWEESQTGRTRGKIVLEVGR